ncbi:MAG: Entner-Doudoroff aldolase [Microbacteriaceae bacterium]|nr:Entner-Doudoroff aldolase [Microbacteriaceae bacterium]
MSILSEALAAVPIVGIIRTSLPGRAEPAARAVAAGGIRAVEVALTTPDALAAIAALAEVPPEGSVIGAGSVRTPADARNAIDAGARFLVTPGTYPDVLAVAASAGVPVLCGAFTPTELDLAHASGAAYVKLFPAGDLGPRYLSSVLAPMPELALVPTGGVTLDNVGEWFRHGARAVAIGGELFPAGAIEAGDFGAIERRAAEFVRVVAGVTARAIG